MESAEYFFVVTLLGTRPDGTLHCQTVTGILTIGSSQTEREAYEAAVRHAIQTSGEFDNYCEPSRPGVLFYRLVPNQL